MKTFLFEQEREKKETDIKKKSINVSGLNILQSL